MEVEDKVIQVSRLSSQVIMRVVCLWRILRGKGAVMPLPSILISAKGGSAGLRLT